MMMMVHCRFFEPDKIVIFRKIINGRFRPAKEPYGDPSPSSRMAGVFRFGRRRSGKSCTRASAASRARMVGFANSRSVHAATSTQ